MKHSLLAPLYHLENRLTFKPTSDEYGALPINHERVTLGSDFGLTLDAAFVNYDSDWVVLFAHGNRYNITRFHSQYELFRSLHLSFFTFDYPGYGRSPGTPSEAVMYSALRAAYAYLVHTRGIKPERIIVYGLSLGAAVCAELLLTQPAGLFIAECPFTNTWAMARHLYPYLPIWWVFPKRFKNDEKFPRITLPLFLFHGRGDRITPYSASEKLYSVYPGKKRLYLVENAGHNDCLERGGSQLHQAIAEFVGNAQ